MGGPYDFGELRGAAAARSRRRRYVARIPGRGAAAIVALAVAAAGCSSAASPGQTPAAAESPAATSSTTSASGQSAVPIRGQVTARFKIAPSAAEASSWAFGSTLEGLAYGFGSIWATDRNGAVVRFDPITQKVVATIADSQSLPINVATGAGSVYVANWYTKSLLRIDPRTNLVAKTQALSGAPLGIVVLDQRVWVSTEAGEVDVLDATTLANVATYPVGGGTPGFPDIVGESIWYPTYRGTTVNRLDLHTGQVTATVQGAGDSPVFAVSFVDSVWVSNHAEGRVSRIDPASASITATIKVPGTMLYGMAVHGGWLWVTSTHEKALFAIDPATNEIVGRVALGGEPYQVLALGDDLWVSLADTGELVRVSVP